MLWRERVRDRDIAVVARSLRLNLEYTITTSANLCLVAVRRNLERSHSRLKHFR